MSSDERRAWPAMLVLAVVSVVLVGVPWAFKLASAPGLGQACGGGFDCAALDGRCVVGDAVSYCTVVCERDEDCPASGYCGLPPDDIWRLWFSTSPMSENVCVPGARPAQAPEIGAVMPAAEPGPVVEGKRRDK